MTTRTLAGLAAALLASAGTCRGVAFENPNQAGSPVQAGGAPAGVGEKNTPPASAGAEWEARATLFGPLTGGPRLLAPASSLKLRGFVGR